MMVHEMTGSVITAAYSIAVKTLGVAIGGVLIPYALRKYSTRQIMVVTQIFSGFCIMLLALQWQMITNPSIVFIFAILFLETIAKQIFEGASELRSKSLGSSGSQRSLQAEILHSFYGAQFWGPIVSFLLLRYLNIAIPLWIDVGTFLYAAWMASQLGDTVYSGNYSLLRPVRYLRINRELFKVFLLRSVGMWLPIGVFNYMLFPTIQNHSHLKMIDSAWIYVAIALGSLVAASAMKKPTGFLSRQCDWRIASVGFVCFGLTLFGFVSLPNYWLALVVLAVGGSFSGLGVIATRSIRRKVTTAEQLPEIMGLELFVGRITDFLVSSGCFYLLSRNLVTYTDGLIAAAVTWFGLAIWAWSKVTPPSAMAKVVGRAS